MALAAVYLVGTIFLWLTDFDPKRLRMICGLCNHHAVVSIPYIKWTERGLLPRRKIITMVV